MTDWFRSWHGAPTDPKWLGIARKANVAPGIAVAVAWALMDRASQSEDRGSIEGYDADGLACFFGCEPEQVEAIIAAMIDKAMIADGRLTSWERRQPKREDDSSKRVREHRERKLQHQERSVTHCNAPDTEKETDTDTITKRSGSNTARDRASLDELERQCLEAVGVKGNPPPDLLVLSAILGWLDAGADLELDILPTLRALSGRNGGSVKRWNYYSKAVLENAATRKAGAATPLPNPTARGSPPPKDNAVTAAKRRLEAMKNERERETPGNHNPPSGPLRLISGTG